MLLFSSKKLSGFNWEQRDDLFLSRLPGLTNAETQKLRGQFQEGIDLGWIDELVGAKVGAVFMDMDATFIKEESLVELAKHGGNFEIVDKITEEAMQGKLDFAEALAKRVQTLKGMNASVVTQVLDGLTVRDGANEFFALCKQRGIPYFLVSGGFRHMAEPLAKKWGFAGVCCNDLVADDRGALTGTVASPIIDANAKESFVAERMQALSVSKERTWIIGDGANDELMLKRGVAIGMHPKPILWPNIQMFLGRGDFKTLRIVLENL